MIVMTALVYDVLVGSGLANHIGNDTLVAYDGGSIVVITTLCLRAARTGIFVSTASVRVANVFRSLDLRWDTIERFDIGQSGLLPQVCRIHTKDGEVLRAFGIQENNVALLRSRAKRPAQKIVAELNVELARRRGTAADYPSSEHETGSPAEAGGSC